MVAPGTSKRHREHQKGWRDRLSWNSTLPCNAPNCTARRRNLGMYCVTHEHKRQKYGHPAGRNIPRAWYLMELEEVEHLLTRLANHGAVQAAIQWLDDLILRACAGVNVPARKQLIQLRNNGVRGRECVKEVLALCLYSYRRQAALPGDIRLTFMIANGLLRLAPRDYKTHIAERGKAEGAIIKSYTTFGHNARRDLGKLVRETLSPFLANSINWLQKTQAHKEKIQLDLRKSINETTQEASEGTEDGPSP